MLFRLCPRTGLFGVAVFLLQLNVSGQQHLYSLGELSDSLRQNFPLLAQKSAEIQAAQAGERLVNHSFLPRVRGMDEINMATDNSLAGTYFPMGIIPSTSGGIRINEDNRLAAGNVGILYGEYDLVNFGLRRASVSRAREVTSLQQRDFSLQLYNAQLELGRTYFNLTKAQFRLAADEENVKRYANIYSIIRALARSGVIAGADSSLAMAELSRARVSYNQSQGLVIQLKDQIGYLTGIDPRYVEIDTVVLRKGIIGLGLNRSQGDSAASPAIQYYRQFRNVLLADNRLINKSYLPRLVLVGSAWGRGSSIGYNDKFQALSNGLGFRRFNYAAGLALTYDLFNEIHRKDRIIVNRYQLDATTAAINYQQSILNTALRQADQLIATASVNMQELPIQVNAARATYSQKLAQYKAGLINLVDLTNAAFVLYRSAIDYIETLSDWYRAHLERAAATNQLDQFIQSIK
jgi:outer membrane protein TolC